MLICYLKLLPSFLTRYVKDISKISKDIKKSSTLLNAGGAGVSAEI